MPRRLARHKNAIGNWWLRAVAELGALLHDSTSSARLFGSMKSKSSRRRRETRTIADQFAGALQQVGGGGDARGPLSIAML